MRVAAIDIGTNTFLCLVAEVTGNEVSQIISDEVEIVRIGEGVNKSRKFSDAALSRAEACLKRFSESIRLGGAKKVRAVATSAARDATNASLLLEIGKRYGISIDVIAGKEEARLTFEGVMSNSAMARDAAVVDVGGGSTEVTRLEGGQLEGVSFDVGGVRLTEMFVTTNPISKTDLAKMKSHLEQTFVNLKPIPSGKVIGVAGTPTTLAALEQKIDYTRDSIEGYELSLNTIDQWIERLAAVPLEQRAKLKGLEPKRADIIVAGAMALAEATRALGAKKIQVSTRGIRYGLAIEAEKR